MTDTTSPRTLRKQAFRLVYESLALKCTVAEIVEKHKTAADELPHEFDAVSPQLEDLLNMVATSEEENLEKIRQATKYGSVTGIGKVDLAVLLVVLTENQGGLDKSIALTEGTKLADIYGATDKSPDFVHAILSKVCA
ncbi:MAG: hypothetical protein LBQ41_01865 [Candidatus Ancillula sp.]|jgi:transcription termination factor NusB|nr:hypothetical protein [Candidatus Ancillula sp.]